VDSDLVSETDGQGIRGIHHVTAIARGPQVNLDFYTGVLGLRLVKRTVNFDDPGSYHLYYGDEVGSPGTILTFFPWPRARLGSRGAGQATVTSFSVPAGTLGRWVERLDSLGVGHGEPRERLAEEALTLFDPDGLELELVAQAGDGRAPWTGGPVAPEMAVRGFHHVTLCEWNPEVTARVLTEAMGFRLAGEAGERSRFEAGAGGPGARVDVLASPGAERGQVSAGTVHHVAFRVAGDREQLAWRRRLAAAGLQVTPVQERQYFRSIYFREPGGVLFEIATDTPGFAIDEPVASLGAGLKLPSWLEPSRREIESALPPLELGAA
jgi:glyoxalase family protein